METNFTKEIQKTISILKKGGIVIYPADTIWGIGCDATDKQAVEKIYALKKRSESKSMIVLVSDMDMLQHYVKEIPQKLHCVIGGAPRPTTVIYKNPVNLAENVIAGDNTVGIRIVEDDFCQTLIRTYGKPIISTSANFSGKPSPKTFNEIDKKLLDNVDYVVNLHRDKKPGIPSRIVRFKSDGGFEFIRK